MADVPEWSTGVTLRTDRGRRPGRERTLSAGDADLPSAPSPRPAGLARLGDLGLVSVVLVPDPLQASPDVVQLADAFGRCAPFKTHLLVDHAKGFAPSKRRRDRLLRRAERRLPRWARSSLRAQMSGLASALRRAGGAARDQRRGRPVPIPTSRVLAATPAFAALAAYVGEALAEDELHLVRAPPAASRSAT